MKLVKPSVSLTYHMEPAAMLAHIEAAGRTCYKSEGKATDDSALPFVEKLIKRGHESVLEHASITARFICDRGVSHELVRHRIGSYSQESTRYCDYEGGVVFVAPTWLHGRFLGNVEQHTSGRYHFDVDGTVRAASNRTALLLRALLCAAAYYHDLRSEGLAPQQARAVLPNALKTEIVATYNLRQWREVLRQRTAKAAHPDMRHLMNMVLEEFRVTVPWLVADMPTDA